MTNPIAVSQRARMAAARSADNAEKPNVARLIRLGNADQNWRAQAFARFEAEIRADERERAAKVAENYMSRNTLSAVGDNIATAIRNQKDYDHE
jgi:hypothetical protein